MYLQCLCYPVFVLQLPKSSGCTGVLENHGQSFAGLHSLPQSSDLTQRLIVAISQVQSITELGCHANRKKHFYLFKMF